MIQLNCCRCPKSSISTDGIRCIHCDKDGASRTPDPANISESGNVSPGYYVPASDASTQATDEDFDVLESTRDASTQTTDDDFLLFEPTQSASTQTTDSETTDSSVAMNQHGDNQEEIDCSFVRSGKRTNSSVSDHFSGNVAATKEVLVQQAHHSSKAQGNVGKRKVRVKRSLTCEKCDQRFKSESTLNVHLQNNCNPNPYKCDQCDKAFSAESKLTYHKKKHTTEKPFKCDQCDFATKWERYLKSHKERCHKKLTFHLWNPYMVGDRCF